jgi:hypothetical protein
MVEGTAVDDDAVLEVVAESNMAPSAILRRFPEDFKP